MTARDDPPAPPPAVPGFDPADPQAVACYDELPLWSAMAGLLLLEHVGLGARRVLDVGCGTGFPLLELAGRLGPRAFLCGVDTWGTALGRARAKARAWGLGHAALARADGAALPLRAGAFDLVVSNLGLHNFADPEATLRECRRVLVPGGELALTSNLAGHMRELYEAYEAVLAERDDRAALGRLREHVERRGSVEGIARRLQGCSFRVTAAHERLLPMRFAGAHALLSHHFIRLGFLPAWEEIVDEPARPATLAALRSRLDRVAAGRGELLLTVPMACVLAEAV